MDQAETFINFLQLGMPNHLKDVTRRSESECPGNHKPPENNMGTSFVTVSKTRYLLLIIDSSGSIGSKDFKNTTATLSVTIPLVCANVSVAAMTFSRNNHKEFCFNNYTLNANTDESKTAMSNAIKNFKYHGQLTRSGEAIYYACEHMFNLACGFNNDAAVNKTDIMFLTDGRSNGGRNVCTAARCFDMFNPRIFAIGIGNSIRRKELDCIVGTNTNLSTVMQLSDDATLKQVGDEIQKLAAHNCCVDI